MRAQLPHPVHFVLRYPDKWRFLIEASRRPDDAGADVDALYEKIATNEECWILSTFLRLRARLSNVYLTDSPVPGGFCVVSGLDFGIRDFRLDSFYVGARSDGPEPALCHLAVVQNRGQALLERGTFIPHWPQPGIVPRDVDRGHRVENMVFYGSEANLAPRFKAPDFQHALAKRGVYFRIPSSTEGGAVTWNDYAKADLVLAVRDLTEADACTKPASKLVNAWLAGVPALLGPEPAFQEARRSELDYFEVKTTSDVLAAVDRLKQDATLYQRCIENGRVRSRDFSVEAVASKWIDFLGHEATEAFERWQTRGRASRLVKFASGAIGHKQALARADKARSTGKRILGPP